MVSESSGPGVGGWATKICSNHVWSTGVTRRHKNSQTTKGTNSVDITLVYVRTCNLCTYAWLISVNQNQTYSTNRKSQPGNYATDFFRFFCCLFGFTWFHQQFKFPCQNLRVYTLPYTPGVNTKPHALSPGGSLRGRVTPEKEKPVTRAEVKDRTAYACYSLTNTQAQQVASAY